MKPDVPRLNEADGGFHARISAGGSAMNKPALVIMAAGMGSRYGGLKQIDPVSDKGEIILDFSLYDAMMAGFEKVIFIIKRENEQDFRDLIDGRAGKHMEVEYAFQELTDIPEGFDIPEGRVKPWGTGHAVLAARKLIDGPFAVINADDYYGADAFHKIYDHLEKAKDGAKYDFSMVAYQLSKTVTENGSVSRGICSVTPDGLLADVTERTNIVQREDGIAYSEDDGASWTDVSGDTMVSMNFWGFTPAIIREMEDGFPAFLREAEASNPLKGEYLLPKMVDRLIKADKAQVTVLTSADKWHGVTYKEDKQEVVDALQSLKDKGLYPDVLWK